MNCIEKFYQDKNGFVVAKMSNGQKLRLTFEQVDTLLGQEHVHKHMNWPSFRTAYDSEIVEAGCGIAISPAFPATWEGVRKALEHAKVLIDINEANPGCEHPPVELITPWGRIDEMHFDDFRKALKHAPSLAEAVLPFV